LAASDHTTRLRIIATSDLHMHILGFDYAKARTSAHIGLAQLAPLIAKAQAGCDAHVLLDNGDFLQGTALADISAQNITTDSVHPMVDMMNHLRYDAAALGNHEFNYGLGVLRCALSGAAFPMLCANITQTKGEAPLGHQATCMIHRALNTPDGIQQLSIGVVGLVPPQIMTWDRNHLDGQLRAHDIIQTARAASGDLRAQGADLVIGLAHSGYRDAQAIDVMENAANPLAREGIFDAIVAGHSHEVLAHSDAGTPVVQPGFYGSHLGIIDVGLAYEAGWQIIERHPYLIENTGAGADESALPASVLRAHHKTLDEIAKPIGECTSTIHSYFSTLQDCPSVQLTARAQSWYVARALKDNPAGELPILSAASPMKAGGRGGVDNYANIDVGPIAIKDIGQIYPFPNALCALRINGELIRAWLEKSAALFNQIEDIPGDLLNPLIPSYNFDVILGLTYQIDLNTPPRYNDQGVIIDAAAHRIQNLCYQGVPVADHQEFIVATNTYRANGGGHFPITNADLIPLGVSTTVAKVIEDYLRVHPTQSGETQSCWSLAPMGDKQFDVQVSPDAIAHLDAVAGFDAQVMETDDQGFCRLRLRQNAS